MCKQSNTLPYFQLGASYHVYGMCDEYFAQTAQKTRLLPVPLDNKRAYILRVHNLSSYDNEQALTTPESFTNVVLKSSVNASQCGDLCLMFDGLPAPVPLSEGCSYPIGPNPRLMFIGAPNSVGAVANADVFNGFYHVEICPHEWNMQNPFGQKANFNWQQSIESSVGDLPIGSYTFAFGLRDSASPLTLAASNRLLFNSFNGLSKYVMIEVSEVSVTAMWKTASEAAAVYPIRVYLMTGLSVSSNAPKVLKTGVMPNELDFAVPPNNYRVGTIEWNNLNPTLRNWGRIADNVAGSHSGRSTIGLAAPFAIESHWVSVRGSISHYPATYQNLNP